MKQPPPSASALRVADLPQNARTAFEIRPDASRMAAIAQELGLAGLRKLSFAGHVQAEGKADWTMVASLGATVIQPCVVTLEPVTTRLDQTVNRLFQRDYVDVDAPEAEMPEDDTVEPLGHWIDPEAIMIEALVLALPLYPRIEGVSLGESVHAAPGVAPMRDEDARPFAQLSALKDRLAGSKDAADED
jgi:uncharacterized metal-binding protein YceD (DUF177 family)